MATGKRLIRADATIDAFTKWLTCTYDGRMPADIVNEIPTVDAVEVAHGQWEKCEADKHGNRKPKCSVCGKYHLAWWSDYTHCNYCPNCGAKMDGDGDG